MKNQFNGIDIISSGALFIVDFITRRTFTCCLSNGDHSTNIIIYRFETTALRWHSEMAKIHLNRAICSMFLSIIMLTVDIEQLEKLIVLCIVDKSTLRKHCHWIVTNILCCSTVVHSSKLHVLSFTYAKMHLILIKYSILLSEYLTIALMRVQPVSSAKIH